MILPPLVFPDGANPNDDVTGKYEMTKRAKSYTSYGIKAFGGQTLYRNKKRIFGHEIYCWGLVSTRTFFYNIFGVVNLPILMARYLG